MKKFISIAYLVFIVSAFALLSGCSDNNTKSTNASNSKVEEFNLGDEKITLHKISVLTNKVDILIPKSFGVMSEDTAKTKYPSERRPTVIYTNDSASINIAFNHTQSKTKNSQIPSYFDSLKKNFENLYPSATWYNSKIEKINDKNTGVFELLTPGVDTEIYNLIWFTDLDGRLLLATFNCTKEQMDDWKPIAKSIMASQMIKE